MFSNLVFSLPFCKSEILFLSSFLYKNLKLLSDVFRSIFFVFEIHKFNHPLISMSF